MRLSYDYDSISGIYDELMQFIPYREWSRYIGELFMKHGGRGFSLLDLGGGTGNLAIPLSERGFDIVMVDRSEKMLQEAQKKIMGKSIRLVAGDITKTPLRSKFDIAVCMYDTVNHIDEEGFISLLITARDLLRDGGMLMFDFNTDFGLGAFASHTQYRDGSGFRSEWNTSFNEKTRVCTLNLRIKFDDREESLIFQERAMDIDELLFAVSNSGFSERHLYHFLTTNGLKRTSERGMAVCIK